MCDSYASLQHPVDPAVRLLAGPWGPELLTELYRGTTRYSELFRALPGISPRTLSAKLSDLKSSGVIARARGVGTKAEYCLTSKGLELVSLLDAVATFTIHWHVSPDA
jgi:DNA-binding HxlR family transcriptional regulator